MNDVNIRELSAQIETVLFYKNEPVTFEELEEILHATKEAILSGVENLSLLLSDRGIVVMRTEGEVALGTAPAMAQIIENIRKQEFSGDLGKAALETLALVLYQGPLSRADIDYIRGVNSQFILRRLAIRGLVEKELNPKHRNSFLYRPSIKLLEFLGIAHLKELPEYEKVQESLANLISKENGDERDVSDGTAQV